MLSNLKNFWQNIHPCEQAVQSHQPVLRSAVLVVPVASSCERPPASLLPPSPPTDRPQGPRGSGLAGGHLQAH